MRWHQFMAISTVYLRTDPSSEPYAASSNTSVAKDRSKTQNASRNNAVMLCRGKKELMIARLARTSIDHCPFGITSAAAAAAAAAAGTHNTQHSKP